MSVEETRAMPHANGNGNGNGKINGNGNGNGNGHSPLEGNGHTPLVDDAATEGTAPVAVDVRAAASIVAAPLQVAPGDVANSTISVTNLRSDPCSFALSLSGLDPAWYGLPARVGPLAPGERVEVPFHLSLPRGYPPCSLLLAVEARPVPGGDVVPGRIRRALPGRPDLPATPGNGTPGAGTGTKSSGTRGPGAEDERRNPGRHDLQVAVGDGASISARLDPVDIIGGRQGKFTLLLRNRGSHSQQVKLQPVSPDQKLEVEFRPDAPLLLPGRELKVAGRVHTRRRLKGEPQRRPFAVRVQGRGTPVMAEGSYTARPLFPPWAFKVLVIAMVVVLWATVALLGIRVLTKHLHQSAVANSQLSHHHHAAHKSTSKSHTSGSGAKSTGQKSTSPSSPGSGSSSSGSTSKKTSKTTSKKSGSTSTPTSPKHSVEVTGKVTGSHPGGVTVTLSPTSLVSPQVLGASNGSSGTLASSVHRDHGHGTHTSARGPPGVAYGPSPGAVLTARVRHGADGHGADGHARAADRSADAVSARGQSARGQSEPMLVSASHRAAPIPDGKVYGTEAAAAFFPSLVASITPTLTTTTLPDGSFVFTGVAAPGTYLVSFTESGYDTRKYVVQTSTGKNIALDTALSPGTGSLSGTVTGPKGPLGGVSITVSDGSVTITTVTPTTGSGIGTWSVSGLNTPDSYLVSASASGYGTQITSAKLAASASLAGVDLVMKAGFGSISGTVTDGTSSQPVGDVTVTATNGSSTATATTSTVSPVGTYTLPNLAIPGTWTLTVTGQGWITQTQLVKLDGNSTVNASLTTSGANVVGVVKSGGSGLANVGLSLSNTKTTYKTLSESVSPVGGYDFGQIPPGQYVLSATAYGYTTQSASVHVAAGETLTLDLTLPYVGQSSAATGSITGSVLNAFSGAALATVPIELDGKSTTAKTNSSGVYTISGVAPGLHEVTALGTAKTFAKAGVQVSVAENATVTAPVIELAHLSTIKGVVTSQLTGKRISGAKLLLFAAGKKLTTSSTAPTKTATSTPSGTYALSHVAAGNYVLEATKKATGYNEAQVDLSVAAGVTPVVQNVSLTEGPTYQAKTWKVTSGHLVPLAYVCVLVTGPIGTPGSPARTTAMITSATDNEVTIPNLTAGKIYEATFRRPTPIITTTTKTSTCPLPTKTSGSSYSASGGVFTAKTDNTTVYAAVLAPVNEGIHAHLVFPYVKAGSGSGTPGTTVDCTVTTVPSGSTPCSKAGLTTTRLPTVSLVGTTSYSTTKNGTPGSPITTTVPMTHTARTNTWSYITTNSSARFYGTTVTVKVTDPTGQFQSLTSTVTLASGAATVTEVLSPVPVQAQATISPTSGASISVLPSELVPTGNVASHTANNLTTTDNITASEGSSAALDWTDPAVRDSGYAQPGLYALTLAETDYATKTIPVVVPLCPTTSSPPVCTVTFTGLSLAPLVTLKVNATNVPPTRTPPTVTLYRGSGTTDALAQKSLVEIGTTFSVTFAHMLTPSVTNYRFTVSGTGIELYKSTHTPTSAVLKPATATAATSVLTVTASLTEDSWLTGTVTGILVPATGSSPGASQALATATVTAKLIGTPPVGSSCSRTFSAKSGSTGSFALIPASAGLCPTGTYTIKVSELGFSTKSTVVKFVAGANSKSFTLAATKVKQTVEVKGVANGVAVKVTALSPIGPTITCTFTVGTTTTYSHSSPKPCSTSTSSAYTGAATGVVFTFSIYPTSYSYSLSAYQYSGVTIAVPAPSPGITPRLQSYTMTQVKVTIEGTVKVSATGSASGAKAIAKLPLTLYTSAGTSKVGVQIKTNTTGTFIFSKVKPGNYLIKVGDAYTTLSAIQISTGTQTLVRETFVVYAPGKQVTIAVQGSTATGTHVHLVPTTTANPPKSCGSGPSKTTLLATGLGTRQTSTAVKTSGTTADAVFTNVVPDVYTVALGTSPSSTVLTLVVCPTTGTPAATTPATPKVTLPTVTLAPSSPSVTYGSETASSTKFTVKVAGTGGHGYPEGTVALTATGTLKALTCPTSTVTHTPSLTTYKCTFTSSKEVGVGSYKVLYESAIPSSSSATHFYGPAKSTTTVTVNATKPAAPTAPSASTKTSSSVKLSWTAPTTTGGDPITGYAVLQTGTSITTTTASTLTYQVTSLSKGTTYHFAIKATNAAGTSPSSASVTVTITATAPSKPTALRETAKTTSTVTLSWTAPATTGGTSIKHYVVLKNGVAVTSTVSTARYKVTGLSKGTTYTFTVEATNSVGTSPPSTALPVTTTATKPAAPTALHETAKGSTTVTLAWTAPTTTGNGTNFHYVVLETKTGTYTKIATPTTTSYKVTGLSASTLYKFKVEATNTKGTSTPTTPLSVTTTA